MFSHFSRKNFCGCCGTPYRRKISAHDIDRVLSAMRQELETVMGFRSLGIRGVELMKRFLLPLVCLVLSLVVSGCSFGERNNASDRKKVQFVTELAEICLEHYESGDCELNQIIKPYQIQRWCDPEDYLYNYIEDNSDSFIMAVIMDEDTVVVNTDCIFQGVYGYLITTQDVDVDQYFMVSPVLHFDGDSIRITSRINNELYYWAAGI